MARSTFANPKYAEAQKQERSTFDIPATLAFWSWEGDTLVLPRGLWKIAQTLLAGASVIDRRVVLPPLAFGWTGPPPFAYQKASLHQAWPHDHGILIGPCGCGKTLWLAMMIAKRQQRALVITPTKELLYQTRDRFLELWNVPPEAVGLIGDGHWQLGTHATIALPHTLRARDLTEIRDQFGLVACDESHLAAAPPLRKRHPTNFRLFSSRCYGYPASTGRHGRSCDGGSRPYYSTHYHGRSSTCRAPSATDHPSDTKPVRGPVHPRLFWTPHGPNRPTSS